MARLGADIFESCGTSATKGRLKRLSGIHSRVIAIVQARMGSTRLPGKVLMPLGSSVVLDHVVRRTAKAGVYLVVVAPALPADDAIALWCESKRIACVRYDGEPNDVFSMYRAVLKQYSCDAFLRVTADCPLIEPVVVSTVAAAITSPDHWDYASICEGDGFINGIDCEGVNTQTFMGIDVTTLSSHEREHVTPRLRNGSYKRWIPCAAIFPHFKVDPKQFSVTLDTPADYEFLTRVWRRFGPEPDVEQVLGAMQRKEQI